MIPEVFSNLTDSLVPWLCRRCLPCKLIFSAAPRTLLPWGSPQPSGGMGREEREWGKAPGEHHEALPPSSPWAVINLAAAAGTAGAVLVCVRPLLLSQAAAPSESEKPNAVCGRGAHPRVLLEWPLAGFPLSPSIWMLGSGGCCGTQQGSGLCQKAERAVRC